MGAQGAVESHVSSSGPSLSQQPHRTAHTQRTSSRYVLRLRVSVVSRLEIACRNLPSQSFHRQHLRSNEAGRPEGGLVSSLSLVCALGRVACEAARRRGREGLEARRLSRSTVLSRSCRCLRGRVYYIQYLTSTQKRRGRPPSREGLGAHSFGQHSRPHRERTWLQTGATSSRRRRAPCGIWTSPDGSDPRSKSTLQNKHSARRLSTRSTLNCLLHPRAAICRSTAVLTLRSS